MSTQTENGLQKTVGIIGCGSMGEAIVAGLCHSHIISNNQIVVYNRTASKVEELSSKYSCRGVSTVNKLVQLSDIIIIGVKPDQVCDVLTNISNEVTINKCVVSMAAGVKLEVMEKCLMKGTHIIRVMPNTATHIGCGITSISPNKFATAEDVSSVTTLFGAIGKTYLVDQKYIHAVIALCGSSPAYIFMFLDALADGGTLLGLAREQSYEMAAQTVMGAAKLMQETKLTPSQLKDQMITPGGTTIEALRELERGKVRSVIMEAMVKCADKSKYMEEKLSS